MQQSVELITIIVLHIYGHDDARVEIMTTVLLFCVCLLFFPFLCRLGLWDCLSLFFLEVVVGHIFKKHFLSSVTGNYAKILHL